MMPCADKLNAYYRNLAAARRALRAAQLAGNQDGIHEARYILAWAQSGIDTMLTGTRRMVEGAFSETEKESTP